MKSIAATETVLLEELLNLKGDFEKINQILAGLVSDALKELVKIWLLNKYLGSVENVIINFSMGKACDMAWVFAETLSPLSEEKRKQELLIKMRWLHYPQMLSLISALPTH